MAKKLQPDVARLLERLGKIEIGESDWIECVDEKRLSYLRSMAHHPELKAQGRLYTVQLYAALTTPAFSERTCLLKITRRT
jgi:hypothetical protein